eukprot:scaffold193307_cov24-Tisochrysis_lutea.AAC.1
MLCTCKHSGDVNGVSPSTYCCGGGPSESESLLPLKMLMALPEELHRLLARELSIGDQYRYTTVWNEQ